MHQATVIRPGLVLPGGYILGERLGSGGMGVVYSAQTLRGLSVVVKVARPEQSADNYAVRSLRREMVAGRRVRHPNVVQVLDYGDIDGGAFIVMERLHGVLLGDFIEQHGTLTVPRVLEIARALLAGLGAMHAAGFVHADVKSDNIIVELQGSGSLGVKLIDLGLARRFGDELSELGVDGQRVMSGTPEYMAPEVIGGGQATAAADIYAVGVILYEMLTGATPFAGANAADVLARQLDERVIPPSLLMPERTIPVLLESAILRALGKDPSTRFPTTTWFAEALSIAPTEGTDRDRSAAAARGDAVSTETSADTSADTSTDTWSTETPTLVSPSRRSQLATGSRSGSDERIRQRRAEVVDALRRGAHDEAIAGSLEIARALVDRRSLWAARAHLEETLDVLTRGRGVDAPDAPAPLWRLLLTLSALYSGLHDPLRARRTALSAHRQATRHGSDLGRDRAATLLERLSRS